MIKVQQLLLLLKSQLNEENQHTANQAASINSNTMSTACQSESQNSSSQNFLHSNWITDTGASDHVSLLHKWKTIALG